MKPNNEIGVWDRARTEKARRLSYCRVAGRSVYGAAPQRPRVAPSDGDRLDGRRREVNDVLAHWSHRSNNAAGCSEGRNQRDKWFVDYHGGGDMEAVAILKLRFGPRSRGIMNTPFKSSPLRARVDAVFNDQELLSHYVADPRRKELFFRRRQVAYGVTLSGRHESLSAQGPRTVTTPLERKL